LLHLQLKHQWLQIAQKWLNFNLNNFITTKICQL